MKEIHYRIILSIIGFIVLLSIAVVANPPKGEIKIVEVEKEKIVEIEKEPSYKYNISSVEREMLARLVYLEANTEGLECQMAVASVVINRWEDGRWGNTIAAVIYSPYQFSPAGLIHKATPTETNYAAVDHVLKNGSILPSWVMYFRADWGFSKIWAGYAEYAKFSNTCFGYFVEDK